MFQRSPTGQNTKIKDDVEVAQISRWQGVARVVQLHASMTHSSSLYSRRLQLSKLCFLHEEMFTSFAFTLLVPIIDTNTDTARYLDIPISRLESRVAVVSCPAKRYLDDGR